jgi:hypothetical protein
MPAPNTVLYRFLRQSCAESGFILTIIMKRVIWKTIPNTAALPLRAFFAVMIASKLAHVCPEFRALPHPAVKLC